LLPSVSRRKGIDNLFGGHTPVPKRKQALHRPRPVRRPAKPALDPKREIAALKRDLAQALKRQAATQRDLEQSLERQTATSDILRVIAGSPGEAEATLRKIAETTARLFSTAGVSFRMVEGDEFKLSVGVGRGAEQVSEALWENPARRPTPGGDNLPAIVVRENRQIQIRDLDNLDPEMADWPGPPVARAAGIRTMVGTPLRSGGRAIGAMMVYRDELRPFDEVELQLLQSFADQAVIAIENTRLFDELQQRTRDLSQSLEQQTATSEVLRVISSSPGDLAPVFETMLANAARLCEAELGTLNLYEGNAFRTVAVCNMPPGYVARRGELIRPHPKSGLAGVARTKEVLHIADLRTEPPYQERDPTVVAMVDVAGARTIVIVPMLKENELIGTIAIYRQQVRPFTDNQIALVSNFAKQAVIAIENARLITETREALEQQSATAEILRVINTSPGELEPVFDAILEKAHRLCGITHGVLGIYDGEHLRAVTTRGISEPLAELLRQPFRPPPNSPQARLISEKCVIHIPDLAAEPGKYRLRTAALEMGVRTLLFVPLRKDDKLLGYFSANRTEVRPFSDKEIRLLESFAAQAVIAMENARLVAETREALEQQTATAEVLGVINSSPGNLEPVFTAMLEKATRLCDAGFGILWICEGERFRAAAVHAVPPAYAKSLREPAPVEAPASLVEIVRGQSVVHVEDLAATELYNAGNPMRRAIVDLGGGRTLLTVALRKDHALLGAFAIYRQEVRPFSDKQIALVQNFAAQAVIAMENARLITETREALKQQTATTEVLQVINSSPGDLAPVFEAMLEKATRLCEAARGQLATYDGEFFRYVAAHGETAFVADQLALGPQPPTWGLTWPRIVRGESVVHFADVKETDLYRAGQESTRRFVDIGGGRSLLTVALRKEEKLLGALTIYRQEVRPFSDKEIALVQNFAAQAVIAMENARLITETREALERQTATAEVLEVINTSSGELEPVFDAILDKALRLSHSAFGTMRLFDGTRFQLAAQKNVPQAYLDFTAKRITNLVGVDALGPAVARALTEKRVVQIVDAKEDELYKKGNPMRRAIVDLAGARTILFVPLLHDDVARGIIMVFRTEVRAFSDKEVALLQNFAAQAVIAMENARLLGELRQRTTDLARSVDELTATGDVLKIISRSTVDLETVLDTLVETVARLCRADQASMFRRHDDMFHLVANRGLSAEAKEFVLTHPLAANRGTLSGRVMLERRAVHIPDVLQDPTYTYTEAQKILGYRTMLGIPLLREETLVGVFTIHRTRVEPFTDKEIELVQTFADQAVIAIENARLFEELRDRQAELARSVDELTATSDVLKIISRSSVDLETVLDTLVETVARLCRADHAVMFRRRDDMYHMVAVRGVSREAKEFIRAHPATPDRRTLSGRVSLERRAVHIPDVVQDSEYAHPAQKIAGYRTMLGIPLLRGDELIGIFDINRTRVEPFADKEIELATSFADQAVIAIENARLFDELRDRQAELRVTFDNMGDGVVMFDANARLTAWNRNFQEMLELPDAFLAGRPSHAEYFHYLADRGEYVSADLEEQLSRAVDDTRRELRFERTRPDGRIIEVRRNAVPGGGFVMIYSDITERKRAEAAISAARDAAETTLRELQTAQASLVHAQKMAALGQLTAGIAHEIKNPLNFVNNFAGLSVELLDELKEASAQAMGALDSDKRAEIVETIGMLTGNLEKIAEHGRRADGIVRSMLQHSRGGSGDWQATDLNALVEEALNLAYHGARAQDQSFNITMERDLDRNLAPIEVVPQDLMRVFLNLIGNGFYAANKRSRGGDGAFRPVLKVTTREFGDSVEIGVRDNGIGIPREYREKLFQPFFTTKPTGEGTGLGLSISFEIVTQQHGGTITVESEVGEFTEFTVRLPRRQHPSGGRAA
jgi:PAS domain S-box-containing protein